MLLPPFVGTLLILMADLFGWGSTPKLFVSKLEIGPETTFVDGPLKADGTIDYEAAYNTRASAGVTPENNAAVLLDRAFGPKVIPADLRTRYYRYLGVKEPPLEGDYIIGQDQFVEQLIEKSLLPPDKSQKVLNEMSMSTSDVWTRSDFPQVAAWIDANQKPLQLLEQASLRSKFYNPLVTDEMLVASRLGLTQYTAQIGGRLLRARAMLRISEGDFDGSANDLLTCERLALLISRTPMGIASQVGSNLEDATIHSLQNLLSERLSIKQITHLQTAFMALQPLINFEDSMDLGQRFMALEIVQSQWRDNISIGLPNQPVRISFIDVNRVMRRCNAHYDHYLNAHRTVGYRNRIQAITTVANEMNQRVDEAKATLASGHLLSFSHVPATELFTDLVIGLFAPNAIWLQLIEDRAKMRREMLNVSFALAAYRVKHGEFPSSLESLVPVFLQRIPIDVFTDRPLDYQRKPLQYVLSSAGPIEKDTSGRPYRFRERDLYINVVYYPYADRMRDQFIFNMRVPGALLLLIIVWGSWRYIVLYRIPKLKVGPDTTIVAGPLRPDGTVDFESALHEQAVAGIAEQDNAAVLLQRAFGPPDLPAELRPRYYRYLGMSELPEHGNYLVDETEYARTLLGNPDAGEATVQVVLDEMSDGLTRPWIRADLPRVAAWIEINQEPLKLIEQASLRPKFYAPVVNDGPLWKASLPFLKPIATAVRLLASRTLLRISEGNVEGATNDLLICHRLASLLGRSSTAAANLLGTSIEAVAFHCSQFLLARPLSIPQIERYQAEITALPPVTDIAATIDKTLRLEMLDGLQSAAFSKPLRQEMLGFTRFSKLDLNAAFRRCNSYFDELRPILQVGNVRKRIELLNQFQTKTDDRFQRLAGKLHMIRRLAWRTRKTLSQSMTDIMLRRMLPDVRQLQTAEDLASMRRQMLRTGLALAAYRATQGVYPPELKALTPDYLQEIPLDHDLEQPWHYQLLPTGYQLSAVSPSENDEDHLAFQVTHGGVNHDWTISAAGT